MVKTKSNKKVTLFVDTNSGRTVFETNDHKIIIPHKTTEVLNNNSISTNGELMFDDTPLHYIRDTSGEIWFKGN